MSSEYERQLEQHNEQLQEKLAKTEREFNERLMIESREAMENAYKHYANIYRWIFVGLALLIVIQLASIVFLIMQNGLLSQQRDMALRQPVAGKLE